MIRQVKGFTPAARNYIGGYRSQATRRNTEDSPSSSLAAKYQGSTKLYMARPKKKRRKRKKTPSPAPASAPPSSVESSVSTKPASSQATVIPEDDIQAMKELAKSGDKPSLDDIKAIANFQPPTVKQDGSSESGGVGNVGSASTDIAGENLVELPDIRNALRSKELKKMEEEEAQKKQRKKISRKDTKAFLEVSEKRIRLSSLLLI